LINPLKFPICFESIDLPLASSMYSFQFFISDNKLILLVMLIDAPESMIQQNIELSFDELLIVSIIDFDI